MLICHVCDISHNMYTQQIFCHRLHDRKYRVKPHKCPLTGNLRLQNVQNSTLEQFIRRSDLLTRSSGLHVHSQRGRSQVQVSEVSKLEFFFIQDCNENQHGGRDPRYQRLRFTINLTLYQSLDTYTYRIRLLD